LPIPNRTVKQLCADDSAATSVKVGYCQACYSKKPLPVIRLGFFYVWSFAFHGVQAKKSSAARCFYTFNTVCSEHVLRTHTQ
ncbi:MULTISPECIES: hypothetical protein, partial [unclassified Janthinobacterium]|uniref:hypothetical protein n=1 Tax=unclassified Janthinobacterium TaxID=2610881 RepID=UPI001C85EB20